MFVDPQAKQGDQAAQDLLRPRQASQHAAGWDLVAANQQPMVLQPMQRALVPTGVAVALPAGYEAQVRPRSGLALKHGVTCLNAPGTIDADYRGEVGVIAINLGQQDFTIERGMRIAQLVVAVVCPVVWQQQQTLPESVRACGGFGSTGLYAASEADS
ncbi:MAG: dUTP diphosphatase [Myxococcota bacterium]